MNQSNMFLDIALSEGMKKTIADIGYQTPTPIQEKSIPELLQGFDLLGQAQTGTGKTAAFAIPLVELVDEKSDIVQALVVCPTRELCLQVCQEIKRLSVHKKGLEVVAIYGGQAIDQQFRSLKSNSPQIIVATPGRLFDHLRRKSVELSHVRMIVLDEADEMLDMGFRPEIEQIFDLLPEENQRIFFSATMAKAIKDLAFTYLRDPKIIKTESKSLTVSTIEQTYFRVRGREKTELLCRMLDVKDPKLAVVFCNAKSTADEIVEEIKNRGFEAGVLHGDLNQNQRDRVMAKFRAGSVRVLVATDVAARGLDIDDVEMVVNYHLPHDPEDYVHRIGRTGRAGRRGAAISLVEPRDNSRLRRISQFAKIEIAEVNPPTVADVKTAKINGIFSQLQDAISSESMKEYRFVLAKQERLSAEDVAAGMLLLALKRFDQQAKKDDTMFEDLRDRKYSGYSPDRRYRDRDRDRDRDRRPSNNGGRRSAGPRNSSNSREMRPDSNVQPWHTSGSERSFRPARAAKENDTFPRRKNGDRPFRESGPRQDFQERKPAARSSRFSDVKSDRTFPAKNPRDAKGEGKFHSFAKKPDFKDARSKSKKKFKK